MSSAQAAGVWAVSACTVAAILVRPFRIAEWVWAVAGAAIVALVALMPPAAVWSAAARGGDVYAFLAGILALAQLARSTHVFDALANRLLAAAGGAKGRLLLLVYLAGTAVTAVLSNDTTIVVLTPAVLAVLTRVDVEALPYLYGCAFVANAASFVLPVSNPANLVIFGRALPSLVPWIGAFGLAAVAALALTYAALHIAWRRELAGSFQIRHTAAPPIDATTRWASVLLALAAFALGAATLLDANVGITALASALIAYGVLAMRSPRACLRALGQAQWSILPLVAGLFVIVGAIDHSGAVAIVRELLHRCDVLGNSGVVAAALAVAVASNLFNNLPVALASGAALQTMHLAPRLYDAILVAIDLGPNLSVSGSLATILWLTILRREGIAVTPLAFLRMGAIVLLPALVAALLLVR